MAQCGQHRCSAGGGARLMVLDERGWEGRKEQAAGGQMVASDGWLRGHRAVRGRGGGGRTEQAGGGLMKICSTSFGAIKTLNKLTVPSCQGDL
eukprot:scaffold233194_cov22-Tisochrysis_lutea.AAC.3